MMAIGKGDGEERDVIMGEWENGKEERRLWGVVTHGSVILVGPVGGKGRKGKSGGVEEKWRSGLEETSVVWWSRKN